MPGGGKSSTTSEAKWDPVDQENRMFLGDQGRNIYNHVMGRRPVPTAGQTPGVSTASAAPQMSISDSTQYYPLGFPINQFTGLPTAAPAPASTGGSSDGFSEGFLSGPRFPGARPVGPSQDTLAGRDSLRGFATSGASQILDPAQKAWQFGLSDVLSPDSNPYLKQTADAATRQITQAATDPGGVFSQIRSGAQEAGQFGGSRQGIAEGVAAGRVAQAVGDSSARLYSTGYGQGLDAYGRALAMTPQMLTSSAMPSAYLSALGATQDAEAQSQENYQAAGRTWDINSPWMQLYNLAGVVQPQMRPGTSTTSNDGGAQAMQTGGQLAGTALMMAMMGCCENWKENIEEIDPEDLLKRAAKLKIFTFNYKQGMGPEGNFVGPMAAQWADLFGGDGITINAQNVLFVNLALQVAMTRRLLRMEEENV